eukprot:6061967-Amphidinium_carterae.1
MTTTQAKVKTSMEGGYNKARHNYYNPKEKGKYKTPNDKNHQQQSGEHCKGKGSKTTLVGGHHQHHVLLPRRTVGGKHEENKSDHKQLHQSAALIDTRATTSIAPPNYFQQ